MLTIAQPFAALALKTGPLNSWGYDPILSPPNGKPMSNSPLLYRAGAPPRFKYYGDGVPVPACTGAIGAFGPQ